MLVEVDRVYYLLLAAGVLGIRLRCSGDCLCWGYKSLKIGGGTAATAFATGGVVPETKVGTASPYPLLRFRLSADRLLRVNNDVPGGPGRQAGLIVYWFIGRVTLILRLMMRFVRSAWFPLGGRQHIKPLNIHLLLLCGSVVGAG